MVNPGQAPGSAKYLGEPRDSSIHIDLIAYTPDTVTALDDVSAQEACSALENGGISWVDVDGIHDAVMVKRVAERFQIHPLSVEDVLNPKGRPKAEYYPKYIYVVLRMVTRDPEDDALDTEQVSLFMGQDFVLTLT